jgi:hypothetical protein
MFAICTDVGISSSWSTAMHRDGLLALPRRSSPQILPNRLPPAGSKHAKQGGTPPLQQPHADPS